MPRFQWNRSDNALTAEDRCIAQARKNVQFQQKWGRWYGAFYLFASAAFIAIGLTFFGLVWGSVNGVLVANPGQQVRNATELGLALGVAGGFVAGIAFYKSVIYLRDAIRLLRGDPADRLLIEYHDSIVGLMRKAADPLTEALENDPPRQAAVPDLSPPRQLQPSAFQRDFP